MYKKVLTYLNVENTVSLNWDKYSKIMPVFLKDSHGIVVICIAVVFHTRIQQIRFTVVNSIDFSKLFYCSAVWSGNSLLYVQTLGSSHNLLEEDCVIGLPRKLVWHQ